MELTSNGYPLVNSPDQLGKLVPCVAQASIGELREQLKAQGYIWLRNFFAREAVIALRTRFFERMRPTGILAENTEAVEGIFSGQRDQTGQTTRLLMEFVRTAAYESFCFQPRLWQFYERLLGGDVTLHKRKIVRQSYPLDPKSTDAHYDLIYLRGGTDSVLSSWIPLGDVPLEMGGLTYLEGSDAYGRQMEADYAARSSALSSEERLSAYNKHMSATGGIGKDLSELVSRYNTRWLVADYEAGDMVIHTSTMIHAATQNNSHEGRMRLSTDIRYQRIRDEIDARWQQHWALDDML
ncbi:MAG: phytanoyl-CoA dioxygenase family protein [Chloroflexi bacterium]|nr:phytanoyl-CoA dioxygenase family protein [Chloroflexota bacterium]